MHNFFCFVTFVIAIVALFRALSNSFTVRHLIEHKRVMSCAIGRLESDVQKLNDIANNLSKTFADKNEVEECLKTILSSIDEIKAAEANVDQERSQYGRYSSEVKQNAIDVMRRANDEGKWSYRSLADVLNIPASTLRMWWNQYKKGTADL